MKYILWDFDGTLAYRDGLWTVTLLSVLKKNGITSIRKEQIRPFISIGFPWNSPESPHSYLFGGKDWWEYMESYFEEVFLILGLDLVASKDLSKMVKDEYLTLSNWHLYDDVEPTLKMAQRNDFENIILSNHVPELLEIVYGLGIGDYFTHIFSSANIGYDKPNKKIFQHVLEKLKAQAGQCIMVGDSYEADIAGALRNGIKAILVRKNNEKDYSFYSKDLNDVIGIIQNIHYN